jgi:CHAD domain-containing protein
MDTPTTQGSSSAPAEERRETEWQFDAPDLDAVRAWLATDATRSGWRLEARAPLRIRDTYYDTDRWSVLRAGFALRVREGEGKGEVWPEATLKSLEQPAEALAVRREIVQSLADADLREALGEAGPVTERVRALVGSRELRPLFIVETQRKRLALSGAGAEAEVSIDRSSFLAGEESRRELRRIEIELVAGSLVALTRWVRVMQSACAMTPAARSKFRTGLDAAGLEPRLAPDLGPLVIDPAMSAEAFALTVVRREMLAMLTHEPGTRLGEDAEALHDLRVAARHMVTYLRALEAHLPARVVECREPLRELLRVLGAARDLDVQLAELAAFSGELSETERPRLEPLRLHLEHARREARFAMLRALDARDTQALMQQLEAGVTVHGNASGNDGRTPEASPSASALVLVSAVLRDAYRKLRKRADRLELDSPPEDFHATRSRGKRLRYLVEASRPLIGDPAKDFLRALRRLQNVLGALQDSHVASERLRALAASPPESLPADTLFLMGRLAERHELTCRRMRKRFPKAWRRVSGRRWKALRRALDGGAARA